MHVILDLKCNCASQKHYHTHYSFETLFKLGKCLSVSARRVMFHLSIYVECMAVCLLKAKMTLDIGLGNFRYHGDTNLQETGRFT